MQRSRGWLDRKFGDFAILYVTKIKLLHVKHEVSIRDKDIYHGNYMIDQQAITLLFLIVLTTLLFIVLPI